MAGKEEHSHVSSSECSELRVQLPRSGFRWVGQVVLESNVNDRLKIIVPMLISFGSVSLEAFIDLLVDINIHFSTVIPLHDSTDKVQPLKRIYFLIGDFPRNLI